MRKVIWAPSAVRSVNAVTLVRPVASTPVTTPVTGDTMGIAPTGGALPAGPAAAPPADPVPPWDPASNPPLANTTSNKAATSSPKRQERHRAGPRGPTPEGHAGAIPVPLLPGLTAGSPAAQRGQVSGPGS